MDHTFDGNLELAEFPATDNPELQRLLAPIHSAIHQLASKEKSISTTIGNQTLQGKSGRFRIAAATASIVITNSLVDANTLVFCQLASADATAWIRSVVPATGSFTVNMGGTATATADIAFQIIN